MSERLFNKEVAEQLRLVHDLMQLSGENRFKVIAFDKAAQIAESTEEDLRKRALEGTLTEIKGIGKSIAEDITQYLESGTMKVLEALRRKVPAGLMEWLNISGLGPKNIVKIHEALGITEVEELREACADGRVAALPGLGQKSADKILKSIEWMAQHGDRCRLDEAREVAEAFLELLREAPGVLKIDVAGSYRRSLETIGDIDILIAAAEKDREAIFDRFTGAESIVEVLGRGETKSSVRTMQGRQVDLRIVSEAEFGAALMYFTGSKEHNIVMRQRARDRGLALNEYGLFELDAAGETDFGKPVGVGSGGGADAGAGLSSGLSEAEIYGVLGIGFVPPELREGRWEVEWFEDVAGEKSVDLVEISDIKGVVHAHTNWSDGQPTLEELARGCVAAGYEYLGLTDHSKSAGYAGGLSIERVREQWDEVDRVQELLDSEGVAFRIFKGIESDILVDGSLDYPDEILEGFDFVIASVHSSLDQPMDKLMKRYEKAIAHPATTMLGHPSGRLLLRRDAMAVDFPALIEMAGKAGVAIELNASPYRLDIDWRWGELMRKHGVRTSINPDAHTLEGIDDIQYGVGIARKAGFSAGDVLNTMNATEFGAWLARRNG